MIRAPLQAKPGTLLRRKLREPYQYINRPQNDSARLAQSHSLFSAMRVCTILFSSESGKGLADGNRIVPLEVGKPSSSFSNFSITPDPVGKRLQWFLNAAYPTSIPLYSNIGIPLRITSVDP